MGILRYFAANSLYGKKRSRLAGPHDPAKPEIKEFNMIHPTDREGYTAVDIYPWLVNHITNAPQGILGAWELIPLQLPAQGSGDHQRVGKSIYLRGIQIRGYIEIRDSLVFPCNWRLVLYRQKRVVGEGIPDYIDLYKNFETMDLEVGDNFGTLAHYRHNFYKSMYNQEYNDIGTRQVLAKGRVVPCLDDPKGGHVTRQYEFTVQAAKVNLGIDCREIFAVTCAYYPIKKILKCNIDIDPNDDFLYLMLETDMPYAGRKRNAAQVENFPGTGVMQPSLESTDVPFKFNIFVRGYFTDP